VSLAEKLDPETPTVVPGGPDSELSVIEGVPEVDVLDVTFVDSVEFESVDVMLKLDVEFVDPVEFESVDVILRLDVEFLDTVELESVDVVLRVELLEFERTLWIVFVTLRLVSETLSFSAEYEALLVTVELLGEEFVKAV